MAEEPKAPPKKGSAFSKKFHGIPVPLLAAGGGLVLFLGYRWYKNRSASSASSTTTAPSTTSTGDTTGTSDGTGGGYGGGGSDPNNGFDPGTTGTTAPTDPTAVTTAVRPTAPAKTTPTGVKAVVSKLGKLTPLGAKTFTVDGTSFKGVSSFEQGGKTYFGVDTQTEAKQLEAKGVTLVHNPNDPSGKGLFAVTKSGSTVVTPTAKENTTKVVAPSPTTSKPVVNSKGLTAAQQKAANDAAAAARSKANQATIAKNKVPVQAKKA